MRGMTMAGIFRLTLITYFSIQANGLEIRGTQLARFLGLRLVVGLFLRVLVLFFTVGDISLFEPSTVAQVC